MSDKMKAPHRVGCDCTICVPERGTQPFDRSPFEKLTEEEVNMEMYKLISSLNEHLASRKDTVGLEILNKYSRIAIEYEMRMIEQSH